MNKPVMEGGGFALPRPSRTVIALIVANVVAYVLQLVLLRTGASPVVEALYLTPEDVYRRGFVFQLFTYGWLHAPTNPMHLAFNMLWLWLFGNPMEAWWGRRRFLFAYGLFLVCGAALTVAVALLAETGALGGLLEGFPRTQHLGASGATIGITVAWGLVNSKQPMQFLLLGRMTGGTFVLLIVGFELLVALSFSSTSSTAHFGGILGSVVLCRGLWRPSRWAELTRRFRLKRQKAALERKLAKLKKTPPPNWRVIEGGKEKPDDPKRWN